MWELFHVKGKLNIKRSKSRFYIAIVLYYENKKFIVHSRVGMGQTNTESSILTPKVKSMVKSGELSGL